MVKKKYRSSLERHNAPFRGTTRREDLVNFDLAIMHDLFHIGKISGLDNHIGHKQKIKDNLTALYYNEGEVTAGDQIFTTGNLFYKIATIDKPIQNWQRNFNATLTPVESKHNTYELKSSTHQAGIVTTLKMSPGDVLSIRVKVEALTNNQLSFAIGSPYNDNVPDIEQFKIADFYQNPHYVEKRIISQSNQTLEIGFYGIFGQEGNSTLRLSDFELSLLYQQPTNIKGIDSELKINLRDIENQIETLEKKKEIIKEVFE